MNGQPQPIAPARKIFFCNKYIVSELNLIGQSYPRIALKQSKKLPLYGKNYISYYIFLAKIFTLNVFFTKKNKATVSRRRGQIKRNDHQ